MSKDPKAPAGNGNPPRRSEAKPELWLPAKPKAAASAGASGTGGSVARFNKNTLVLALLGFGLVVNILFTAATARKPDPLPPTDERVTDLLEQVKALSTDIKKQGGVINRQSQDLARLRMDLETLNLKVANLPLPPDPGHRNVPMDNTPVGGAR